MGIKYRIYRNIITGDLFIFTHDGLLSIKNIYNYISNFVENVNVKTIGQLLHDKPEIKYIGLLCNNIITLNSEVVISCELNIVFKMMYNSSYINFCKLIRLYATHDTIFSKLDEDVLN